MESYFIIIIILIIFMTFYGGKNKLSKIEYQTKYFSNLQNLMKFEKKINIKNDENIEFIDISNKLEICIIPNLEKIYYLNLKPYTSFKINDFDFERNVMIIFNHKKIKFSLILKEDKNFDYLFNLNKKINILDIYPIFNNNYFSISLTIFIFKKPYWFN